MSLRTTCGSGPALRFGAWARAEQVFLAAFEDCLDGMPVFKECVPSWSKRAVIKAAIRAVRLPAKEASALQKPETFPSASLGPAIAAAIAKLPELNRFVYVLSVLERYSDRECSVLLDSTIGEIVRARNKTLQQLANALVRSGEGFRPTLPGRTG